MSTLAILCTYSTLLAAAVGMYVMAFGQWHHMGLKFTAVAFSTLASIWLIYSWFFHPAPFNCSVSDPMCRTVLIYNLVRNLALATFCLAVGRDAIRVKSSERRKSRHG